MPTRLQLRRLELGYPWHHDWTPDPELHNQLQHLADIALHHISVEDSQLAPPAARAIEQLTDALRAVLPRFLAEHAATAWLMLGPRGGGRLGIVESVRYAAVGHGPTRRLPGMATGMRSARPPRRAG